MALLCRVLVREMDMVDMLSRPSLRNRAICGKFTRRWNKL